MRESTPFVIPAGSGQTYRFTGILLGTSDSRRPGVHRWIAFALYRTTGGAYVLSRTGHSLLFHAPDCEIVDRNNLRIAAVPPGGLPCELCHPNADGPVCPETPRQWAGIFHDPGALLAALRRGNGETQYMTKVAARLIEAAAVGDRELAEAWSVQLVD